MGTCADKCCSANWDRAAIAILAWLLSVPHRLGERRYLSNDEEVQHRYGELIVNYYASGFRDTALFNYVNLYLYGKIFDILAVGAA